MLRLVSSLFCALVLTFGAIPLDASQSPQRPTSQRPSSEGTPSEGTAKKTRCRLPSKIPRAQQGDRPDIVLIAIDTLRADHLGFLGHRRETSPNLDRLAEDSLVYERAIAAAPWTTPSFAGIFTGRHPAELGFEGEPIRLPNNVPTLGELLTQKGYLSVGVISHFYLGNKFGFHRGFHFWNQNAAGGHDVISSERVSDLALDCLEKAQGRDQPLFLFAHYFDPHYDYLGHDEHPFHAGYEGEVTSRNDNFEELRKSARAGELSGTDLQHLRNLYDSEIAFTDRHIGRLLAALERLGRYDEAIIVVLADHGELFAEKRGRWIGHTRYVYDELVHVPLTIKLPKSWAESGPARAIGDHPRKGRIARTVSLVDVMPTLLGLIDAESEQPRSLIGSTEELPVFTQTRRWSKLDAVYQDRFKLTADRKYGGYKLFDLEADPREERNLARSQPKKAAALLALLDAWDSYNRREEAKMKGLEVPELSDEEIETLRSLGYITGGSR